ncbi:MAG: ABC transporter ATP-binding protein [Actinomycetota bacterium]|jgi:ABC-type multidrug transport system fused ATPase/permease subunit
MPTTDRHIIRRGLGILKMSIRLQPKAFSAGLAGSALYAGMTVAEAFVLGRVTDEVIVPAIRRGSITTAALVAAVAAIMAVALLKAIGIIGRRAGAFLMQYRLQADFRRRVTEQYQKLSMEWHRGHSTGSLLSNANSDVEAMFWLIAPLPLSCGVLFMVLITFVLLIATDPILTVIGVLLIPTIATLSHFYNRRAEALAMRAQEMRAQVSGVAHESFDGALVVKTLGLEEEETERFAERSEELRDELIGLGSVRAIFDPILEALPNIAVIGILVAGTFRIDSGDLTTGELVQFAYLFTQLAFPIRAVGWILGDMPRAVIGWDRVKRILSATDELSYGEASLNGSGKPAQVDVRKVSYSYEDDEDDNVIHDVDFDVTPGRTIALVGPTGSGKSTITDLLVRLADPHDGMINIDDADLRGLRRGVLPANIAIVFQESFLFDDTVRGNITLGAEDGEAEVREAAQLAQADAFVSKLPQGYDTIVGERGTTLSGGQRQRVALARALVRRPRLLIMDDATSSVDPTVEQAILRGLQAAALPSTVVIVAYRRATIALADEVLFLNRGTIEARGTHEELARSNAAYFRLVSAYDGPQEVSV